MRLRSTSSLEAALKRSEMVFLGVVLLLVLAGVGPWWVKRELQRRCIVFAVLFAISRTRLNPS